MKCHLQIISPFFRRIFIPCPCTDQTLKKVMGSKFFCFLCSCNLRKDQVRAFRKRAVNKGSSNVLWMMMCLCILQVNYLFAQPFSTWHDSNVFKKSQKRCKQAVASCIGFFRSCCKYEIISFPLKDFRQQSLTRAININSVYVRSIKKREPVNMYREEFSKHSSKIKACLPVAVYLFTS